MSEYKGLLPIISKDLTDIVQFEFEKQKGYLKNTIFMLWKLICYFGNIKEH